MKDNIVLIGMPGVGKSTVGVILAKVLGRTFIDSDIVIQQREGALLCDIIKERGIEGFLKTEEAAVLSIDTSNAVIATGGSVVYGKEAMEHLSEIGKIVYLELDYETLNKRLTNIKSRGVVTKKGQDLLAIYEERIPLYEKYADITINECGLNVEETIEKIVKAMEVTNV